MPGRRQGKSGLILEPAGLSILEKADQAFFDRDSSRNNINREYDWMYPVADNWSIFFIGI